MCNAHRRGHPPGLSGILSGDLEMTRTTSHKQPAETARHGKAEHPQQRLPCRGCTSNCRWYQQCEGKPWRMDDPT